MEWMERTKAMTLAGQRRLVFVTETASLGEAVQMMASEDLRSIPVVEHGSPLGFFDFMDFCAFFATKIRNLNIEGMDEEAWEEFTADVVNTPVRGLIDCSGNNPYIPFPEDATMMDISRALAAGARRVALVDQTGRMRGIVSQSAVVKFLCGKIPMGQWAKLLVTLEQIPSFSCEIVSLKGEMSSIEAFLQLADLKYSSLPVSDEEGLLVGALSCRDLRVAMATGNLGILTRCVTEYISLVRRQAVKTVFPFISCKPTATLEHVMHRLSASRIQRVYIVADNRKPIGVATLGMVLREIIQ